MPRRSLPDISQWQLLALEFVAFPLSPAACLLIDGWKEFTGSEAPEAIKKKIERTESGLFQDRMLLFKAQPLRVSWSLAAKIDENTSLPALGSFLSIRDWFGPLVSAWLASHAVPLKRIGFTGRMALPTDNTKDSYLLLGDYLPSVEMDPDSADFLFQINRPRQSGSGVRDLTINRLSQWSSYQINVDVSARNVTLDGETRSPISESKSFGCLWGFDFNTSQNFSSELPRDKLPVIASELLSLATEVAMKGDVK